MGGGMSRQDWLCLYKGDDDDDDDDEQFSFKFKFVC